MEEKVFCTNCGKENTETDYKLCPICREVRRKYRESHAEYFRTYNRLLYNKNKDKINEYRRKKYRIKRMQEIKEELKNAEPIKD